MISETNAYKLSGSTAESLVGLSGNGAHMSEIVVSYSYRLQIVDTDVHVEACLDVVSGDT